MKGREINARFRSTIIIKSLRKDEIILKDSRKEQGGRVWIYLHDSHHDGITPSGYMAGRLFDITRWREMGFSQRRC
jgi:hypothetical protein